MWNQYFIASNLQEAASLLAKYKDQAKIIAGGTDLILEIERGGHTEINTLIDISRIAGLDEIHYENDSIHIGALVTHNQAASSAIIQQYAGCLAEACYQVGSPQIRNRATIAGNLLTASPANDTITPLVALDADLVLISPVGERKIKVVDFYIGVRKTLLQKNEILKEIIIKTQKNAKSSFYKFALRNAQAISVVNAAVLVTLNGEVIESASVALGAVAPTIVRILNIEKAVVGKKISDLTLINFSNLMDGISPISDIRSSANYREEMSSLLVKRCFENIHKSILGQRSMPENPITLDGRRGPKDVVEIHESTLIDENHPIETNINGQSYTFFGAHRKTLLHLVRENAGLVGSKEGCDEGECGACTMYLDGKAVMSCLVPAPRAHHARIQTIEGVSDGSTLHPVQKAFIEEGAVQCGYCTPGFIMSAVKLLEEKPNPSQNEIKEAITGNLCRCTGYYKIVKAIEKAALKDKR